MDLRQIKQTGLKRFIRYHRNVVLQQSPVDLVYYLKYIILHAGYCNTKTKQTVRNGDSTNQIIEGMRHRKPIPINTHQHKATVRRKYLIRRGPRRRLPNAQHIWYEISKSGSRKTPLHYFRQRLEYKQQRERRSRLGHFSEALRNVVMQSHSEEPNYSSTPQKRFLKLLIISHSRAGEMVFNSLRKQASKI